MLIMRPVRQEDLEYLYTFAKAAAIGLIHLPPDKARLSRMIHRSLKSFEKNLAVSENELYMFVLEDLENKKLGGCCGIYSNTGVTDPVFSYRVEILHPFHIELPLPNELRILHPRVERDGPSELCALFLMDTYRKEGVGRLLSLSRFLFMASHPHRFTHNVIAQLRGFFDQNNICIFWEGVGRQFLDVSFNELLDVLQDYGEFIPDIVPRYPIYVNFLPKRVQDVIGKTHPGTLPALHMLSEEGFRYMHQICFDDGGPYIVARVNNIRTIQESSLGIIKELLEEEPESEKYLVANTKLDYRCAFGQLVNDNFELKISKALAEVLKVNVGDPLRFVLQAAPKRRTISELETE